MAMMITNISGAAISLPYPYYGVLGPGHGIVFEDTEANIIANLGGAEVIDSLFKLTAVPGVGVNPISTQQNPPVNVSQITGNLPLTQTSGTLPTTRLSGILVASQIVSQADATYWVDAVLGNDANAGTAIAPFKTIGAATALIPHVLKHNFTVNIKAGTYIESIEVTTHLQSSNVFLKFVGQDWTAITPATGVQTGTFTSVSGQFATRAAAGWTVDDLKKKFVKLTSGTQSGKYFPIAANTIDTIEVCAATTFVTAFNGCTFELVMPAVIIQPNGTPNGDPFRFRIADNRFRGTTIGQIEITNMQLIGHTVASTCLSVVSITGYGGLQIMSCYLKSRAGGIKTADVMMPAIGNFRAQYCVCDADTAASANSGMNISGGCSAIIASCFVQPGAGSLTLPFTFTSSNIQIDSGTIISGFTTANFSVFTLQGGNVKLFCTACKFRSNAIILRANESGNIIIFQSCDILACSGVAIDLSTFQSMSTTTRGGNSLFINGSKITGGLSDAIRVTCPYNHIALSSSDGDISGNAGWGINLAYPVPLKGVGGAYNYIHMTSDFLMSGNALGDFSIDGTTALSLAALRALPGKVATDANFFNRIFSE